MPFKTILPLREAIQGELRSVGFPEFVQVGLPAISAARSNCVKRWIACINTTSSRAWAYSANKRSLTRDANTHWRPRVLCYRFYCHASSSLMRIGSKLGAEDFAGPFISAGAWGHFSQKVATSGSAATLAVHFGSMRLDRPELIAPAQKAETPSVMLAGKPVAHRVESIDGRLAIVLTQSQTFSPGRHWKRWPRPFAKSHFRNVKLQGAADSDPPRSMKSQSVEDRRCSLAYHRQRRFGDRRSLLPAMPSRKLDEGSNFWQTA